MGWQERLLNWVAFKYLQSVVSESRELYRLDRPEMSRPLHQTPQRSRLRLRLRLRLLRLRSRFLQLVTSGLMVVLP